MKFMLALLAAVALATPAIAQEAESTRKVKVKAAGGVTIEEEECEECEDGEVPEEVLEELKKIDETLPERLRKMLKRVKESGGEGAEADKWEGVPSDVQEAMAKIRERVEKIREQIEKDMAEWESDPDAEVEEYEETSPDGSSTVKVKIIRIRKVVKEGDTPEAPESPKKEPERKQ